MKDELLLKYLEFFRVKDWFFIVGLAYLGYFYELEKFVFLDFLVISLIAILYLAHGYSINNYFDLERQGIHSEISKLKIACITLVINCIISFFYSWMIFILVVLGGAISFLYSSSINLKSKPFWNIVLNSTGFTLLFLIGYTSKGSISTSGLAFAGYIWLGIIPAQIIHLLSHKNKGENWPFSERASLGFFYLAHLLWLSWTFFALAEIRLIFWLTLIFSLVQLLVLSFSISSKCSFYSVRNKLRILNVVFGMVMLAFILGR